MAVTTYVQALVVETVRTGIGGMRRMNDALRHKCQALRGLKRRTWRVLTHNTAVQQGFPHVLTQQTMALRALASYHHARVVAGRRYHTQHLTRLGFDSHNGANLSLHQSLTKCLQVGIQSQCQVLASNGTTVEAAILIAALHTTMSIT